LLGAGLMHQKVMEHSNIPHLSGIAAGMGIERMAMTKYGITDIRDVYNNDFRFIKQFGKGNK
jgi:phenylalanyl-tRNA synthetase alpha chain